MFIVKRNDVKGNFRRIFLALVFMLYGPVCFSQTIFKQVKIPLDNLRGVPFSMPEEGIDYNVGGFEVDNLGRFYFSGGRKPYVIAVFNGNKLLLHKEYNDFGGDNLLINNNELYMFDMRYSNTKKRVVKDLYVLNKYGSVVKKYPQIITGTINGYRFIDTCLIIDTINTSSGTTLTRHLLYNLSGKFIKQVDNEYNLPAKLPKVYGQFVGKWEGKYVFCNHSPDSKVFEFSLVNEQGGVISKKEVSDKIFGQMFYEDPDENKKLRNQSIYILGRDGRNALITELPLTMIFKK